MAIHNIIGQKGEEIAAGYLVDEGYKILEKNWRFKKIELDIIARKDDLIVVVEVKTRTSRFVENLSEIVPRKKQKSIILAADAFIDKKELSNEVRFDIIFIELKDDSYHLDHLKEAFTPIG
jgi:putative endonuclease